VVSVNVINEVWFQAQPEDVQEAILEAGRVAEQDVLQWGIDNVGRANQVWLDNGGQILDLSDGDMAEMRVLFADIAEVMTADPAVSAAAGRCRGASGAVVRALGGGARIR